MFITKDCLIKWKKYSSKFPENPGNEFKTPRNGKLLILAQFPGSPRNENCRGFVIPIDSNNKIWHCQTTRAIKSLYSMNYSLALAYDVMSLLADSGFFLTFSIKLAWNLEFLGYWRTLSLKFQKAMTKTKVFLTLPCWLLQFRWDSQQRRVRKTSILVVAFWNFKSKVLKYQWNFRLYATVIWFGEIPSLYSCSYKNRRLWDL